jgi:hypothetical protein
MEFRKILDRRGTVVSDPMATVAPLKLGRAYVVSGEPRKQRARLPEFSDPLERWRSRHSFCHYASGTEAVVEIESEWSAGRRERAAGRLCPAVALAHSSQKKA